MKKMETLSQDIYNLIKAEGSLYWREIRDRLWEKYKSIYKDIKVFGSAISNRLNQKPLANLIVKKGDQYATQNFKPSPKQKPKTSRFIKSFWRELNEITELASDDLYLEEAFERMLLLTRKLPRPFKDKLNGDIKLCVDKVNEAIDTYYEARKIKSNLSEEFHEIERAKWNAVYILTDKISTLLHEYLEK